MMIHPDLQIPLHSRLIALPPRQRDSIDKHLLDLCWGTTHALRHDEVG